MVFEALKTPGRKTLAIRAVPHFREMALLAGAYMIYVYTRAIFFSDVRTVALENAQRIVDLEKKLGFFWEPTWQNWTLDAAESAILFFNWVYIFTFWPVILTTAVILYVVNRKRYFFYRNVILVSFVVAMVMFALFPLAPPRMLAGTFVDTIASFGPAFYASRDLANFYNVFAAMPSLHFAWTLVFGYMFLTAGPRWLKVAGIMYPAITLMAITITGNHYILNAVGGGVVMGISMGLVFLIRRRRVRKALERNEPAA